MQRWTLPFLALVPFAAPCGAAEDFAFEVERTGERMDVRAQAVVAAPLAVVWSTLTDYEGLPRFIPGIAASTVLSRQGNRLLVEQRGEARFLFFSFPVEVRLDVVHAPPDRIASRAVGGNMRRMTGLYEIMQDDARGGIRLRYVGEIEPDFELPPLVGMAVLHAVVEEQFSAMVAEIERRAAASR